MTLEEFNLRLNFSKVGYGTWRVYLNCYSRGYRTGITHDSLAIDRIHSEAPARSHLYGYTLLQAYAALYSCLGPEFHKR